MDNTEKFILFGSLFMIMIWFNYVVAIIVTLLLLILTKDNGIKKGSS
jgi:hypothetical protein